MYIWVVLAVDTEGDAKVDVVAAFAVAWALAWLGDMAKFPRTKRIKMGVIVFIISFLYKLKVQIKRSYGEISLFYENHPPFLWN